jgi:hypothetical protein
MPVITAWHHSCSRRHPSCQLFTKTSQAQTKYTTLEKELLSRIFMTFKEFATMLLGTTINIHTNHKNLTYSTLVNKRVLHQLSYVKEFGPTYCHIAGKDNFLADMFSHLDHLFDLDVPHSDPSKRESSVSNFSFLLR